MKMRKVTPQMTGECNFGMHEHCSGAACECSCHGPRVKDTYRWRRDSSTGKRYLASVKRVDRGVKLP